MRPVDGNGFLEEVAKVFGVPFEVIPFKAESEGKHRTEKRHHVHAVPQKVGVFEIQFPRVEGYPAGHSQSSDGGLAVHRHVCIWTPMSIPPEVQVKATLPSNIGRPTLTGPGKLESL